MASRSSRKRKNPPTEEEDDEAQRNGATGGPARPSEAAAAAASSASLQMSPPGPKSRGMSLRSGRKKRRRSRETTGLTPPEQQKQKQQNEDNNNHDERHPRKKGDREETEGSKDEDASMDGEDEEEKEEFSEEEEDQDEMEEEEKKQGEEYQEAKKPSAAAQRPGETAASAATAPAAAAASAHSNGRDRQQRSSFMERVSFTESAAPKDSAVTPSFTPGSSRRLEFETPLGGPEASEEESQQAASTATRQPTVTEVIHLAPDMQRQTEEFRSILAEGSVLPDDGDVVREEERVSLMTHWYRLASAGCSTLIVTVKEASTTLIFPQADGEEEEVAEDEIIQAKLQPALWMRTDIWFVFLLLLQLCFWPLWFNPILTTVMESSDASLRFYKSKFVTNLESPVPPNETSAAQVDHEPVLPPIPEPLVSTLQEIEEIPDVSMDELVQISGLLTASDAALTSDAVERSRLVALLAEAGERLEERQENLLKWESSLRQTEHSLESAAIVASSLQTLAGSVAHVANSAIEDLSMVSPTPITASVLDATSFPIQIPTPMHDCSIPNVELPLEDPFLTPDQLATQESALVEFAQSSVSAFTTDSELSLGVRSWVRDQVNEVLELNAAALPSHSDESTASGLSEEKSKSAILGRIEVERADQTGKTDFASLSAGATVLRTGARSTTPSLIDNLPILNRWMASMKLRFYGYGPEAALTPTYPSDSLGQCWAFESVVNMKDDRWRKASTSEDSCGAYGTLTVRLAKPVKITSVAIEHAPKERSRASGSAIRDFRVFGYSDTEASGTPFPLGTFRYNMASDRSLQEFEVSYPSSQGSSPVFQAVTLAIDSNWGQDYACLYRFRVHGDAD